MCDNDSFTKVSIVRKLLEKKIDKIHENLNERLKVLNEELDSFEKDFAKETEKDETELNKLTQYRLHTIELFDEGDYQLTKIENRIELLRTRIEQRRLKLEFDDVLINSQVSSLGQLIRMEDNHEYALVDEFQIQYETFEENDSPEETTKVLLHQYETFEENYGPIETTKVPLYRCETPPIKMLTTGANRATPPPVAPKTVQNIRPLPTAIRRTHSSCGVRDTKIETVGSPSKIPLKLVPKRSNSFVNRLNETGMCEDQYETVEENYGPIETTKVPLYRCETPPIKMLTTGANRATPPPVAAKTVQNIFKRLVLDLKFINKSVLVIVLHPDQLTERRHLRVDEDIIKL